MFIKNLIHKKFKIQNYNTLFLNHLMNMLNFKKKTLFFKTFRKKKIHKNQKKVNKS